MDDTDITYIGDWTLLLSQKLRCGHSWGHVDTEGTLLRWLDGAKPLLEHLWLSCGHLWGHPDLSVDSAVITA